MNLPRSQSKQVGSRSADSTKPLSRLPVYLVVRYTGGTWTRPDLAVVGTKAYPYLPGRDFQIVTFEVKTDDAIDVTGVFEALSHLQFATISYVVFCTNGHNFDDYPDTERVLNLAKQHGVGVIAASDKEERF